jgi:hypothetical protein
MAQIGAEARERARGHGRVEARTISVVNLDTCPDLSGECFPHAAQAIKLVRRRQPLRPGGRWDVTFDEDRSTIRTGHGPQVMAALRATSRQWDATDVIPCR